MLSNQWSNQELTMVVLWLLRAAWIAGTLPIMIASIPSSKFSTFHDMVLWFGRRGKIMESSSKKPSVPQKLFCHFYILAVIWTTFLLVATWLYAYKTAPIVSEPVLYSSIASQLTGVSHELSVHKSHLSFKGHEYGIWKSVFLLFLLEVQVLRRFFEGIYVFKYSPSARMHIVGYLTGLFFYTAAPLSLCCTYVLEVFKFVTNMSAEFVVKGKDRMQLTDFDLWGHVNPLMHLKWYVWIGAAFFSWGWVHQRRCHAILVMYGGLVIASGFSDITVWLLFGFVVANLSFTAAETHRWYLHKFENYPRNRCAIIPFVY